MSPNSGEIVIEFLKEFKQDIKEEFRELKSDIKEDIKELRHGRDENKEQIEKVNNKLNKYIYIGSGMFFILSFIFALIKSKIIKF